MEEQRFYCPKCEEYKDKIIEVFDEVRYNVKVFDKTYQEYEDASVEEQDSWGAFDQDLPSHEICPDCNTTLIAK
jgi:rubredoxin